MEASPNAVPQANPGPQDNPVPQEMPPALENYVAHLPLAHPVPAIVPEPEPPKVGFALFTEKFFQIRRAAFQTGCIAGTCQYSVTVSHRSSSPPLLARSGRALPDRLHGGRGPLPDHDRLHVLQRMPGERLCAPVPHHARLYLHPGHDLRRAGHHPDGDLHRLLLLADDDPHGDRRADLLRLQTAKRDSGPGDDPLLRGHPHGHAARHPRHFRHAAGPLLRGPDLERGHGGCFDALQEVIAVVYIIIII